MKKRKVITCITTAVFCLSLVMGGMINTGVKAEAKTVQKNVITYFPNWAMYNSNHQSMTPKNIPWDKITVVNHSFFTVDANYKIASLDTFADFDKQLEHSGSWDQPLKGCFGEYKYYKGLYPDKKILVSVGGWTRGEHFHDMALTSETRKVFTDSVVAFLKEYPFLDGIDIDWEYPGIDRKADPNDSYDKGCPGGPEDKINYTLLLKDIRNAYNDNGLSDKMLTVAAAAGYNKMELVEPEKYSQYLDFMNVMTYDIHGAWENTTNHQAALYPNPADPSGTAPTDLKNKYNTDYAMKTYRDIYKISASKLNVGSPLYSRGWKGVASGTNGDGLYQPSTGAYLGSLDNPSSPGGQEPWFKLKKLETTAGWKKYYDEVAKAVYLYNSSTGVFLTYEDEKTLNDRCDYVLNNGYGGMLIWDASNDDLSKGCPMTTIISNKMKGSQVVKLQAPTLSASTVENGAYTLTATVPANNTATSYKVMEGTTVASTGTLVSGKSTTQDITLNVTGKAAGTYNYTVELSDATASLTSNQVSVTVSSTPVGNTLKAPKLSASAVENGAYTLTATVPANNTATSYKIMEGTTVASTGTLVSGKSTTQDITLNVTGKAAGTYNYTVEVNDATASLTSNQVSVIVSSTPVGNTLKAPKLSASAVDNGSYTLTATVPANNTATSYKVMEGITVASTGTLVAGKSTAQDITLNVTGKAAATYNYTVVVSDATASLTSNEVSVTVSSATVGNVPAKPSISYDNWSNGANFNIVMSMWWGENGTSWKLYENGVVVSTKVLTANGTNAQTGTVAFTGKAKGTYVYQAELVNAAGSTLSDKITYTVN